MDAGQPGGDSPGVSKASLRLVVLFWYVAIIVTGVGIGVGFGFPVPLSIVVTLGGVLGYSFAIIRDKRIRPFR